MKPNAAFFLGVTLLLAALFLFVYQSADTESTVTNESTPTIEQLPPGILTNTVTADCDVVLTTASNEFVLPTQFDPSVAKCEEYVVSTTAPSGLYAAFEDLSPKGVDAQLNVFFLDIEKVGILDDYDTFSIFDLAFLADDRLVVLFSQGLNGKQFLRLYDTNAISQAKSELELDSSLVVHDLKEVANQYVLERELTELTESGQYLRVTDTQLQVLNQQRDAENPLVSLELSEL
jgi:hypothetical protein